MRILLCSHSADIYLYYVVSHHISCYTFTFETQNAKIQFYFRLFMALPNFPSTKSVFLFIPKMDTLLQITS